jgi:hypothetical protein
MKKILFISILFIFQFNEGCAQVSKNQNERFVRFVRSFESSKDENFINFGKINNISSLEKNMTKEEALEFVYHTDDTSKLYCNEYIFSMETEEVFGVSTELTLPQKWQKVDMEKYIFIMYTSYSCQNPDERFKWFLTLCIVDNNFNVKDSLTVFRGYEIDFDITGLLNPKNGKIFLLHTFADWDKKASHDAYIYAVNKETLKFEVIQKGSVEKRTDTSNLMDVLEKIGWNKYFF